MRKNGPATQGGAGQLWSAMAGGDQPAAMTTRLAMTSTKFALYSDEAGSGIG